MTGDIPPTVVTLLSAYLDRTVGEQSEEQRLEEFVTENQDAVVAETRSGLQDLLVRTNLPFTELERLANHRLEDETAARAWLASLADGLDRHSAG